MGTSAELTVPRDITTTPYMSGPDTTVESASEVSLFIDGHVHYADLDPSAGSGLAAKQGAFYQRINGANAELWFKVTAADTGWTKIL